MDQTRAAQQRQRLFYSDFLEADLTLCLILKKGVGEVATHSVLVDPSADLSLFRALVEGRVCLFFAFAADTDEDVDEHYAGEERDVGISDHGVISVVFEHPTLAVCLGLAGKRVQSAAMLGINLPPVLRRAYLQASQVGRVLGRDFRLVKRDGGGGVNSYCEEDDENQISNYEDCSLPGGRELGTDATLTEIWVIRCLGVLAGGFHRF